MTVRLREDIEALKTATGNGSGGLGAKVTALETAVGGTNSGLVKDMTTAKSDISALKGLIADDGETKTLFGMTVTINAETGVVSLTAPASEG